MEFKKIITFAFCLTTLIISSQIKNPKNLEFTWKTDTLNRSVPLSEIQIVLPKGSFPTLDQPKFVGREIGMKMFYKNEPMIVVEINNNVKAYSLNILTMHEIANDQLGDTHLLITYCPLCNSGIIYNRKVVINGVDNILKFEASGMLRNSDMVMLDRDTESLWQQMTGKGIVGTYNNIQLEMIPSIIISLEEFFIRYPYGEILSKDTGFEKHITMYGKNLYDNYDGKEFPYNHFFNSNRVDKRLPAMERVVDIEDNGLYKIYPFSKIKGKRVVHDTFNGESIVLFYKSGTISILDEYEISESKNIGSVTVFNTELDGELFTFSHKKNFFLDKKTKSKWDITGYCFDGTLKGKQLKIRLHGIHFAFAWLAFHPESKIYKR